MEITVKKNTFYGLITLLIVSFLTNLFLFFYKNACINEELRLIDWELFSTIASTFASIISILAFIGIFYQVWQYRINSKEFRASGLLLIGEKVNSPLVIHHWTLLQLAFETIEEGNVFCNLQYPNQEPVSKAAFKVINEGIKSFQNTLLEILEIQEIYSISDDLMHKVYKSHLHNFSSAYLKVEKFKSNKVKLADEYINYQDKQVIDFLTEYHQKYEVIELSATAGLAINVDA